eukprot:TRINITY_DN19542_c0_g1_i1.p1 TRINITY_DN19542_c0_g1~~TRINITY_DN19542_c0_g1_i1.p1  ORF type:complete len:622 (+),score=119.14 TRINITY_DN19542_c0_g1_i1:162-2027(+)
MHMSRSCVLDRSSILLMSMLLLSVSSHPEDNQPLAKIKIYNAHVAVESSYNVHATPVLLGLTGENGDNVTVNFQSSSPTSSDWIAVFSPANFNGSTCPLDSEPEKDQTPLLCTAPIKFQYANYSNPEYKETGRGSLQFTLINQRADFAFALFTGGLSNPLLKAISNPVSFVNPKAPAYPRLALGKQWNEMAVTWTSGYGINEAVPLVKWGFQKRALTFLSPAGTETYTRTSMCGPPARTLGWRDPGFIHTSFLKELWPNTRYYYKVGHQLFNGSQVWGPTKFFKAPPYPGEDSLQRIIVFGDMGKAERDKSNEYSDYQPGCLNTTDRLIEDLDNFDIVMHIGDLAYANGYLSQWDQFTAQIEPIASQVPYMVASGNHERDWPGTGSFYQNKDSGGECGVPTETTFYVPAKNRAKFWYATDFGMFHFCVADSEHDWREGTEQYKFIEDCLASADRQKQPWLIFIAHRVLGYSSDAWYASEGAFEEPMGRESLQQLWQKYKVDIAFFGHVHNYERICPIYESTCVSSERSHYSGTFNATIHIVAGGGGSHLSDYAKLNTSWSLFKDYDFGFVKLTAFNHSTLLFEYKKSSDGKVYDQFWISREYRDVLGCDRIGNCPKYTLAS